MVPLVLSMSSKGRTRWHEKQKRKRETVERLRRPSTKSSTRRFRSSGWSALLDAWHQRSIRCHHTAWPEGISMDSEGERIRDAIVEPLSNGLSARRQSTDVCRCIEVISAPFENPPVSRHELHQPQRERRPLIEHRCGKPARHVRLLRAQNGLCTQEESVIEAFSRCLRTTLRQTCTPAHGTGVRGVDGDQKQ